VRRRSGRHPIDRFRVASDASVGGQSFACQSKPSTSEFHNRQDTRVLVAIETPLSLMDWMGREIAVTDWFSISQDRIQSFADVTEDQQWIHLDRVRAERESPHGTTIAHGFLTLSLLSRFLKEAIQIRREGRMSINYGLNRVRFPSPVRVGSRIRASFTIQSTKQLPGALEVVFHVTVESEGNDKPCCVAEWVIRYYS
jgi:acyl dehydratase